MKHMFTTSKRIRLILKDCRTEADAQILLRSHKIRYKYSTDSGFLSIVIPTITGSVRVYRTASRSKPLHVDPVKAHASGWDKRYADA